jgi:hypothetical protein
VLRLVKDFTSAVNIYVSKCDKERTAYDTAVLRDIGVYFTQLFRMFGVLESAHTIGFPLDGGQQALETLVSPMLYKFATLREQLRALALSCKGQP